MDQAVVDAVRKDWTTAPVSDRVRAGLSLAQRMTQEPTAVDAAFVQGLRDQGLTNAHMERVANIAFVFAVINRGADAVQFPVPQGDALGVVSKELNHAGTSCTLAGERPCTNTWWPRAARVWAVSRPMPSVAPVTRTVLGMVGP